MELEKLLKTFRKNFRVGLFEVTGFLSLTLLLGCVAGEGGKKKANCLNGQTFNSVSRTCQGASISDGPPIPTLKSLSLLEDSGASTVALTYTDIGNDFATSCNISAAASSGLVKRLVDQGLIYTSNSSIVDAHNTRVTIQAGGALALVPDTSISSIREVEITVGPTTSSLAIASAINAHPVISTWMTAAATANQVVTANASSLALDNITCTCFGGKCQATITPTDNYYGTTEFTYSLTDNDGTSATQVVSVVVSSVNDAPVGTVIGSIGATERFDTDTSTLVTGSLIGSGIVSANDTADGDVFGALLSFELVSSPGLGTLAMDSAGNFSYYTYSHTTTDSFIVRLKDPEGGVSSNLTIPIVVTTVNDPPVGTLTSLTAFNEDGSAGLLTLTYNDEEGDLATKCNITTANKVFPDGGCFCIGGTCQVVITGLPNQSGTGYFGYKIFDAANNPPPETTAIFTINSVSDSPIVFPSVTTTTLIQGLESDTFEPSTYTFTLDGATDDDGNSIINYSLITAPASGSITGCLGNGSTGLSCTYTPEDGNIADSANLDGIPPSVNLARIATDSGTFYATTLGDSYDGFPIELVNIRNTDESINTLYGANAYAQTDGTKVVILFQSGLTTGADIQAAINANSNVSKLISFDPIVATQGATGTINLASGAATADKFTFQALDSSGATNTQTVHISIVPVNDRPTLCEYSSYADTKVCGLNGCIANSTPASITPDQDGLTFYSLLSGACYKSSGGVWQPIESYIGDRTINELDPIVIDKVKIDEGGGIPEDTESLTITGIDSSDEDLVPLGNIQIFFNNLSSAAGTGASAPFALAGSGGASADLQDMKIVITPQTINPPVDEKMSEIEITIQDSTGRTTEVVFNVTVQKVSATHGGWAAFKATGPKVDTLGLVNEDRSVCPYSLDMCESGNICSGTSSPISNSSADPDHPDAIFRQESGSTTTCFRMKRTKIQNLAFVGKTSSSPTIEFVEGTGAAVNTASVSVTGSAITVTIYDDVTTTDTIVTALRGNASADALVKVINLKAGETQDNQSVTSVAPLSNTSWESFETYCNATPAALEPGCSAGSLSDRKSCMGEGSPSGVITPTQIDSRYWDEEANVCYRSTGTTNTSWIAYDAPAEVEISWNQFTVNGSASISEYRVFRRLANEEFDFSQPINKSSITGSSLTYTFTDNAANSIIPPAPNTVYYYVIRPVVGSILTSTAAETGTNATGIVRMMAPPKNMAFAHRWMINKNICSLMNRTSDSTNNYRCLYKGAGDTTVSGTQYYDYGKDLLIDRFEAGCPFSSAPNCPGTFDNSCIGVDDPTTAGLSATANLIYYSRGEGKCYMADGATWNEFGSGVFANYFANVEPDTTNLVSSDPQFDTNSDKRYHRSSQPPLTNVTQADANTFCRSLEDLSAGEILGVNSILSHKLPGRKEQVAYSLWDSNTSNDSEVATLETGLSLNSNSKCNSSGASGLDDGYVDFDKPDSNDFYSLPGTASSNIRSITTGSNETANCTSAFGVQDAVGNVSEWLTNGFNCPLLSQCFGNETLIIQDVEFTKVRPAADGLAVRVVYLNGSGAVATISIAGGTVTIDLADIGGGTPVASDIVSVINGGGGPTFLSARVIGSTTNTQTIFGNGASFGAEVTGTDDTSLSSSDTTDDYGFWSLDGLKGPCVDSDADTICDSNISFWAVEDERFSAGRFMTPMGLPAHVSAGSTFSTNYDLFEIGPTSGITSLQLHDDTVNFNSRVIASDLSGGCGGLVGGGSFESGNGAGVWNLEGLACTGGIGVLTVQDITFKANTAADLNIEVRFVDSDATVAGVQLQAGTLMIDLAETGNSAAAVVASVLTEGTLEAFVSGTPTATQAAFSNPVSFTDLRTEAVNKRVDVGFRCVMEVDNSAYAE